MKKQHYALALVAAFAITSCSKMSNLNEQKPDLNATAAGSSALTAAVTPLTLPTAPNNKIAYYAFDATPTGSPVVNLPLTNFANFANEVVLFEGSAWEMADSVHYGSSSSYILTVNPHYHSYHSIIADVRILQSRGVKVLMNVDDATSWNTTTPFTTWNGTHLTYTQFAAFLKACIIDSLHFDGIALDVEHLGSTPANTNYTNLIKAFGSYFGPLSSNSTTTVYTAAIYDGAAAGTAIGQNTTVAQYLNFVEDMGYWENNTTRFNRWATHIGNSKTMVGVSKQYNSLSNATTAAGWEPSGAKKAGIMVFAGNVDSSYTNTIFRAVH
ncbi:EndoS/ChiA family endoglycosidase [Puia sp.]|uniref:EndoS/ChiA family endoglycosidase n=1 Tax=Puia sp. TaxID=2045100 RepID=UPI002F4227ED